MTYLFESHDTLTRQSWQCGWIGKDRNLEERDLLWQQFVDRLFLLISPRCHHSYDSLYFRPKTDDVLHSSSLHQIDYVSSPHRPDWLSVVDWQLFVHIAWYWKYLEDHMFHSTLPDFVRVNDDIPMLFPTVGRRTRNARTFRPSVSDRSSVYLPPTLNRSSICLWFTGRKVAIRNLRRANERR